MTVSTTARKVTAEGNAAATVFSFNFKTLANSHIKVVRTDSSGIESTLTESVHYSLSLNGDQDLSPGGTLTYPLSGDPLPSGEKLTIYREVPLVQDTDLQNQGDFYAQTHEDVFDRLTMLVQQVDEKISRAALISISSESTPDEILEQIISDIVVSSTAAKTAAETAQAGAEAAEALAEAWASQLTTPVDGGLYSSRHYATNAAASAVEAAGYASTFASWILDYGAITEAPGTLTDYGSIA